MKIVFVVPNMIGGGTERIVSILANEYVQRGIDTAILIFAGDKVEYELDSRVEIVKIGGPSNGSIGVRLKRIKAMRKYYRQNRDCVIFAFSVMGAVFSYISTAGSRHPMLVSERNNPEEYDHKWLRDFFYRRTDRVILQTKDVLQCFDEIIQKKAVVIPNPIDPDLPPVFEGKRVKKITAVGRLEEQKNHRLLIEAFYEFQKEFPEYTLELYGRGSLENDLKKLVKTLEMEEKVHFNGFCANAREEISDSMIYVLPSRYEGISNSMIEALAMGIPVIATDCPVGGTRMCIRDGENGIMIPVDDKRALYVSMKKIASDEQFALSISKNGAKLREQFSIGKIADKLLDSMALDREGN